MVDFYVQRTRDSIPQYPVELNKSHELYPAISGVVVPAWRKMDTWSGDTALVGGIEGQGIIFPTESTAYSQHPGAWSMVSSTNGFSHLSVFKINVASGGTAMISGNFALSTYGYAHLTDGSVYRYAVTSGTGTFINGSALTTNVKCNVGVITTTTVSLYEDGVLTAGPTAHSGATVPTGSFRIGSNVDGINVVRHEHYLDIIFNRPLTSQEVYSISMNPYSVFEEDSLVYGLVAGGFVPAWAINSNVLLGGANL